MNVCAYAYLQDEGVAMEACEFWWEFLKNRESAEFLLLQHDAAGAGSVLSTLIPALISRFPLTTEQVGGLIVGSAFLFVTI